jgi:hypothetical protein
VQLAHAGAQAPQHVAAHAHEAQPRRHAGDAQHGDQERGLVGSVAAAGVEHGTGRVRAQLEAPLDRHALDEVVEGGGLVALPLAQLHERMHAHPQLGILEIQQGGLAQPALRLVLLTRGRRRIGG